MVCGGWQGDLSETIKIGVIPTLMISGAVCNGNNCWSGYLLRVIARLAWFFWGAGLVFWGPNL